MGPAGALQMWGAWLLGIRRGSPWPGATRPPPSVLVPQGLRTGRAAQPCGSTPSGKTLSPATLGQSCRRCAQQINQRKQKTEPGVWTAADREAARPEAGGRGLVTRETGKDHTLATTGDKTLPACLRPGGGG